MVKPALCKTSQAARAVFGRKVIVKCIGKKDHLATRASNTRLLFHPAHKGFFGEPRDLALRGDLQDSFRDLVQAGRGAEAVDQFRREGAQPRPAINEPKSIVVERAWST